MTAELFALGINEQLTSCVFLCVVRSLLVCVCVYACAPACVCNQPFLCTGEYTEHARARTHTHYTYITINVVLLYEPHDINYIKQPKVKYLYNLCPAVSPLVKPLTPCV